MNDRMKKLLCYSLLLTLVIRLHAQKQVDICIYGGTSAGVIAAYSASRLGMKVLLIEPGNHLGGLSSGGLGQTDIGNKIAITGLSRDFYKRIGRHYGVEEQWIFEPHVAEEIFNQYIAEATIEVWYNKIISSANKYKGNITQIKVVSTKNDSKLSQTIKARMYIDCSYEGDMMAKAGVSFTIGRESNSQYGETYNGVQLLEKHQFPDSIDPYKIPGKPGSGLLWGIQDTRLLSTGSADKSVQAYNFRLCLSTDKNNWVPIEKPSSYDSTMYDLLLRQIAITKPQELNWQLMHIQPMPNHKTDINNNGGFSTDMIGSNFQYAEADYNTRKAIIAKHENYTKGLLYFIGNDPRMPVHLQEEMKRYGYPKDEYIDHDHFTPQLYIREARRMIGSYVMRQQNCQGIERVSDSIGLAAYTMDSHNCQRLIVNGMVKNEGDVQIGGFGPYPISYRAIIPKKDDCTNLLVPVCLSATHIAYGSIRMEPVFMVLAQSAALAASLAIVNKQTVQKVNVLKLQYILRSDPLLEHTRW